MKKAGLGRPSKDPANVRSPGISIRLTPLERETIETAAGATGMKISEWTRAVLLTAAQQDKCSSAINPSDR
jgi:uncharacterized protein (DUF1778 family)